MKAKKNVRKIALGLLDTISRKQTYSNLLLNKTIHRYQLESRDAAFLTELVYGTLQRQQTLDFYLQPFVKRKIDDWVQQLLRLTMYQLVFLDKVPEHAAIFEAVEIAKDKGHKGIASFVNGVLRSVQRKGVPSLETIKNPIERVAVETSHPQWLVARWVEQFGMEQTKKMCLENLMVPHQTARVNLKKITRECCLEKLEQEGFLVKKSVLVPEGIQCLKGNLAHSKSFEEGLFTIQDESSMLVAHAFRFVGEERVLDACAAPGGKTTHIAEKLTENGQVVALDIHEHKVKLLKQQAERLGHRNILVKAMDSNNAREHFSDSSFDSVLLDAPCSGLGVLKRKPDIKYQKQPSDLEKLQHVQLKLLRHVAPLVKEDGQLVYSTCTVNKNENEDVVASFLAENSSFELDIDFKERMPEAVQPLIFDGKLQILPHYFGTDGFFIASFRRKV